MDIAARALALEAQRLSSQRNYDFYNNFEAPVVKAVDNAANPFTSVTGCFGMVFKDGATYHMYTGMNGIYHATSSNGVTWSASTQVLSRGSSGEWDASNVYCPMVWKEDTTWYMIYTGYAADGIAKVGLATAADPAGPWTKNAGNPVYVNAETWGPGAESWGIIKVGTTYYLWINNYGAGTERKTGLITSDDLISWTPNANNPIFTGQRFCPWPFVFGNVHYLIVAHQYAGSDYACFELYRSLSPTFLPAERDFLGVIKVTDRNSATWNGKDMDTPAVLMTSIAQSLGTNPVTLNVYYSGQDTAVWRMGLFTIHTDKLMDGTLLPEIFTSTSEPGTAYVLSTEAIKTGSQSLKVAVTDKHEYYQVHVNKASGFVEFFVNQTAAGVMVLQGRSETNKLLLAFQLYDSKIQFGSGATITTYDTGFKRRYNEWYHTRIWFDSVSQKWGFRILDRSNVPVLAYNNLVMAQNKFVESFAFYRIANPSGVFYIDDLRVGDL